MNAIHVFAAVAAAAIVQVSPAGAEPQLVWGIKSKAPTTLDPSMSPTALFRVDSTSAASFAVVGNVTLDGAQVDADGLAQGPDGMLYAYVLDEDGSRLVTLDPTNAQATVIGPVLEGRDIRGAVMVSADRIVVLDSAFDELLDINPASGTIQGGPRPLLSGCALDANTTVDLAMRADGQVLLVVAEVFRALDLDTGVATVVHVDNVAQPGGGAVAYCGLAFGLDALADMAFALEVNGTDDLFAFDTASGFARTLFKSGIVTQFNSGRGDLASWVDATPIAVEPGDPADLNGDGAVNGADLGILLAAWGPCPVMGNCCGDLSGDGTIDGADLGMLLAAWTM